MPVGANDAGRVRVAVLMATHNGARFLEAQLTSLADQQGVAVDLWVSDDGSTDATSVLLDKWQAAWRIGQFRRLDGPQRGFAANFQSLLVRANATADYFAFADQDDVWDPDKLAVAIAGITSASPQRPALYCSRTRLVDDADCPLGQSPLFRRRPDFRNALVQSIGGGNTMVMNRPAFRLLAESARRTGFVSHDWWAYLIIAGAGGEVRYDPLPHIGYRQHAGNLVGNNVGPAARLARLRRLFAGQLALWNAANLDALERCADLLTPENRRLAAEFRAARQAPLPVRLYRLARSGLYRQTRAQTFTLWLAAAADRL